MRPKPDNGKGDEYRRVNLNAYEANYRGAYGISDEEVTWDRECPDCGRVVKHRTEHARDMSLDRKCSDCVENARWGMVTVDCPVCEGSGTFADPHHGHAFKCSNCNGTGKVNQG